MNQKKPIKMSLVGLLGCTLWMPLFAEELITETDIFSDITMVSSVSRISQTVAKAAASITIIDKELILASGAQNWVDLFRLVPGMQTYSINANRPGIDYHGTGVEFPRQIEVTVDGRSVYQPLFSTVEWSALNVSIEDIEYIEVVRGSNAASQGSNAFKGAINIFTEKPHLKENTRISLTTGSRETRKVNINHNGFAGVFDYQVNLGFEHNEGFPGIWKNPDPEDNGQLEDGRELYNADLRVFYTPNIKDTYEFNVGASHNHTGWGDADHPSEYTVAEWDTRFESARWGRLTDRGDELSVHVYHSNFKAENDIIVPVSGVLSELLGTTISPADVPFVLSQLGAPALEDQPLQLGFGSLEANRYDVELEHRLQLSEPIKISWGAGYRYEDLVSEKLLDRFDTITSNSRRIFASTEWTLSPKLVLNLGGLAENNSIIDTVSSYRVSINYLPVQEHAFRLSYAHGERTPSLLEANERNLDRLDKAVWNLVRVTGDLYEEEITSYELAYLAQFGQNISFDIKVFREEMRDIITDERNLAGEILPLLPSGYSMLMDRGKINRNKLELDLEGVEFQARIRPTARSLLAFHYTYLDLDGKSFEPGNNFPDRPNKHGKRIVPHTVSLLSQLNLTEQLSASLWVYHMNEVNWDDGNFIDEFTRADVQLRYNFPFAGEEQGGAIALIAQNLGKDYSDYSVNNVFETHIFLKLELELP